LTENEKKLSIFQRLRQTQFVLTYVNEWRKVTMGRLLLRIKMEKKHH
jgi:hypothetical protein